MLLVFPHYINFKTKPMGMDEWMENEWQVGVEKVRWGQMEGPQARSRPRDRDSSARYLFEI